MTYTSAEFKKELEAQTEAYKEILKLVSCWAHQPTQIKLTEKLASFVEAEASIRDKLIEKIAV